MYICIGSCLLARPAKPVGKLDAQRNHSFILQNSAERFEPRGFAASKKLSWIHGLSAKVGVRLKTLPREFRACDASEVREPAFKGATTAILSCQTRCALTFGGGVCAFNHIRTMSCKYLGGAIGPYCCSYMDSGVCHPNVGAGCSLSDI